MADNEQDNADEIGVDKETDRVKLARDEKEAAERKATEVDLPEGPPERPDEGGTGAIEATTVDDAGGATDDGPASGTVDEVVDRVGDDPDKARAALDAENAGGQPRSTLVARLERIIEDADG